MQRTLVVVGALIALAGGWAALSFRPPTGPRPLAQGSFRLAGVTVVEPTLGRTPDASIEVRDSLLAQVGSPRLEPSPGLEDLRGGFVLPGLMDLHTHFPPDSPLALTEYFGILFLAHGVTTVRDAGDLDGTGYPAARNVYVEQGRPGPRPFSCGPFVGGPGQRWTNAIELETQDYPDANRVVAQLIDAGYACIKVYDNLTEPGIRALVRAAKKAQLPAIGHVPYELTFEEARLPNTQHLMGFAGPEQIAAGDSVLHRVMDWSAVDDARIDEVVEASVTLGLTHTPTLVSGYEWRNFRDLEAAKSQNDAQLLPRFFRDVTWDPKVGLAMLRGVTPSDVEMFSNTLEKKLRATRLLHERGVPLQIGTDTLQPFVAPGVSVWTEMRLFERAGIPAEEVWAYATWKSATDIPIPSLGRLAPGAPADFLVFAEDPTESLDALESLRAVVVDGVLYRVEDLDGAIADFQSYYSSWLVDRVSVLIATQRLERVSAANNP